MLEDLVNEPQKSMTIGDMAKLAIVRFASQCNVGAPSDISPPTALEQRLPPTSCYPTTNGVIVDEGHRAVYNQICGGVEVVGTPEDDQRFIPAGTGSPFARDQAFRRTQSSGDALRLPTRLGAKLSSYINPQYFRLHFSMVRCDVGV
jgi:hypothetical protein